MFDRNNYANNDVEILYRLYLMYLMYVHNYSAQSVDSSERMIVMLCAYKVSFRIGFFQFLLFLCLICVQRNKNETKSFCVAAKNGINMRILTKMSCSYSDNRLIFPDNASSKPQPSKHEQFAWVLFFRRPIISTFEGTTRWLFKLLILAWPILTRLFIPAVIPCYTFFFLLKPEGFDSVSSLGFRDSPSVLT